MSLPKNCPTCGSDDPKRWDHANSIDPGGCANPWHESWCVITERADGPDLADLVRLVHYLSEREITYRLEADPSGATLRWHPADPTMIPYVFGGRTYTRPEGVVFVGPDGNVYDANREAL